MPSISALEIHVGSFTLEIQQSILVWLILCVVFATFFIVAGKKIERQDPSKASKGIVYISEEALNLVLFVIKGNLRETTKKYIPLFGTLILMMIASNLIGLIGLQNPTSNVSFNATLAITMWLMIQGNAIKKGGLIARLKELNRTYGDINTTEYHWRNGFANFFDDAFIWKYFGRKYHYDACIYINQGINALGGVGTFSNTNFYTCILIYFLA